MEKDQIKYRIKNKLNREFIGQKDFFDEITNYFISKIEQNEKGILLVAGKRNTFKKVSIRYVFEELYKENLITRKRLEEIDLDSYNFNLGYNAFLSDLYEMLNSDKSEG